MAIFSDIMGSIDGQVANYGKTAFEFFGADVQSTVQLASAMLCIGIGVAMYMQTNFIAAREGFIAIFKIGLVGVFATSWSYFSVFYRFITDLPNRMGAALLSIGSGDTDFDLYSGMDKIIDFGTVVANNASASSVLIDVSLTGLLVGALSAVLAAVAVVLLATAKIGVAFCVGIAPLFILATMAKATRDYFQSWLKLTVGFAIVPLIAAGVLSVIIGITLGTVSTQNNAQIDSIGEALEFIVLVLVAIVLMARIPAMAQQLSGSIVTGGYGVAEASRVAVAAYAADHMTGGRISGAIKGAVSPSSYRGAADKIGQKMFNFEKTGGK